MYSHTAGLFRNFSVWKYYIHASFSSSASLRRYISFSLRVINKNSCTLLLCLTMRCWKSQERMMLVACLGRTPRLFLDFLSSLSNRDDRSMFTLDGKTREERKRSRWYSLVIVATETKGDNSYPGTPPQV